MIEFTLDLPSALALVIQVALPLLVGLVTKQSWSANLKALTLLGLTAATQFATVWYRVAAAGEAFDWKTALANVLVGFALSVGAHYGYWKPSGATRKVQKSLVKDQHTFAS